MSQDQRTNEKHSRKTEPNAHSHLLHDDPVLVKEDVGLGVHEASRQNTSPLLGKGFCLLEDRDLLLAVRSVDVSGTETGHLDLPVLDHHIVFKGTPPVGLEELLHSGDEGCASHQKAGAGRDPGRQAGLAARAVSVDCRESTVRQRGQRTLVLHGPMRKDGVPRLQTTIRIDVGQRDQPRSHLLQVALHCNGAEVLVHDIIAAGKCQATGREAAEVDPLLIVVVAQVALVGRQVHDVKVSAEPEADLPSRHCCHCKEDEDARDGNGWVACQESDHGHKSGFQERWGLRGLVWHAGGLGTDAEARVQARRLRAGTAGIKGQERTECSAVEKPDVEDGAGGIDTEKLNRGEHAGCSKKERGD